MTSNLKQNKTKTQRHTGTKKKNVFSYQDQQDRSECSHPRWGPSWTIHFHNADEILQINSWRVSIR